MEKWLILLKKRERERRQAASGGSRWVQTQLVYKGGALQPLCMEVIDDPRAWFELVTTKCSPIIAAYLRENLITQVSPAEAGSAQDPHVALDRRMGKGSIRCH